MVRGKTITSIEDWRSSRMKTAMRSPFFVYLRLSEVMTPPTEQGAPSDSPPSLIWSIVCSDRRFSAASAPISG